ncbi:hypothetical protein DPMN_161614 [Dreissena polymorpha]|uniref:Uncharacterized protein n=1 Tax=Dreissena polymorpha TaxID=45954 RepID=A0A9D4ESG8_DREPO|nr:hypothetical protein DPMN_161614 [Dreissena polymorpha]
MASRGLSDISPSPYTFTSKREPNTNSTINPSKAGGLYNCDIFRCCHDTKLHESHTGRGTQWCVRIRTVEPWIRQRETDTPGRANFVQLPRKDTPVLPNHRVRIASTYYATCIATGSFEDVQ